MQLKAKLESIQPIKTIDDLRNHAQLAIAIEHSTLPPYFTALYSIENGQSQAYKLIHPIMMEEMLHLGLAANLLNAVGGKPELTFGERSFELL